MNRAMIRLTSLLLAATVMLACGARTGSPPPAAQSQQATTDPSELMWRELAEAARPEGKLVIATNNAAMRETVVPAFKQRFGIDVELLTGRGSDTVARIMRERDAGVATVDIIISGMGTVASQLYPAGGLASIKSMLVIPEVTDVSKWRDGRIRFADPDGEYILRSMESVQNNLVINTDVVKRDEVRRSDDLLNPKFRGKISTMDPLSQGGGDGTAGYFLKTKGEDYLKRLYVDQQLIRSTDDRQLTDWLARGVYPITLTMTAEDILQLMRDGINIEAFWFDDIPPMVGAGGAFLSVMNPTPHPNAVKLWVNWYASREGQELAALALGQPSNRLDVEANKKLPAFLHIQPGRDSFDLNDWQFVTVEERPLRARMRDLLGG
jgi:ABC-type Fe3+ transport system substrate-binding protein